MTPIDYNNPNDPWRNNGYDPYKGLSDEERMKAGCMQVVAFIVMIIVGLALCALFGSCTTTKYVPVPEYHTDTLRITKYERDSIYVERRDSVSIKERNDTVLVEKWHWRDRWRDRIVHDTLYQSQTDSIPYPVEVPVEVPAKLTWWQQTRLHLANILLWLCGGAALFFVFRRWLKV